MATPSPYAPPGFVTGRETPDQRLRRLRETNKALEAQRKREEERESRRLFKQIERQGEIKFSPPSPPRTPTAQPFPVPLEEVDKPSRTGTQTRFESTLDGLLEEYEAAFNMTPLFGSQAYESAERRAVEVWTREQSGVPNDIVAERSVGLLPNSRILREGLDRPPPDVDSKFDITVANIKADVGQDAAVDIWLQELEKDIRKDNPDADDQIVREQLYRTLRLQEHLSDVLDEWGYPRNTGLETPSLALDEALRREEEENGKFFEGFPDRPGLLERISSLFSTKWIPIPVTPGTGGLPAPLRVIAGGLIGTPQGRKALGIEGENFLSLDDVHRGGQIAFADPIAGLILRGDIPIPRTTDTGALLKS